jgi:hypothetical protein
MTWNHRIIRHHSEYQDYYYSMHEVYYDDRGHPTAWIAEPIVIADSMDDLRQTLALMLSATFEPVLEVVNDTTLAEVKNVAN